MITEQWKKSPKSGTNSGSCVEVRRRDGTIQVRDSKDREGPVLTFDREGWKEFVHAVREGNSTCEGRTPPQSAVLVAVLHRLQRS